MTKINFKIYFPTNPYFWLGAFGLILANTFYIYSRRLYLHSQPVTPEFITYLLSKGFAWAGLSFMLLAVAIGPLARLISPVKTLIRYRKDIGVIGFYLILFHFVFGLLLIPTRFPVQSYLANPVSFLSALIAILILVYITHHSRLESINILGLTRWKIIQRLVYLALILAVIHYLTLGPLPFWKKWLANPTGLPPLGLLVTTLVVVVLLLRLIVIPLSVSNRKP